MPIPLGSVTVTASGVVTVYAGTPGTVGAVAIYNESPYAINASAGTGALPIMAQTVDILYTDTGGFSGNITLTTSDYLSNASDAPSFIVFLAVYQPGEPIRGTYPAPLMRLAAGGAIVTNTPANVFEQDLFTPFVLTGYVATKDGSVVNQLDVTAGVAFLRQASDSSLLRIANNATTYLTTIASTTYYLDLNPDGSWSWATSHSGVTNHLTIASVTTDGSANISAVTDARTLATTVLGGATPLAAASLEVGNTPTGALVVSGSTTAGAGSLQVLWMTKTNGTPINYVEYVDSSNNWGIYDNTNAAGVFSASKSGVTNVGPQSAAGLGVAVIVAQAINTHVTATTDQTILSFTPSADGMYRVSMHISLGNNVTSTPLAHVLYTDPNLGTPQGYFASATSNTTNPPIINGSNSFSPGISLGTYPITIYAKAATAITVHYTDGTGTPNDYVTAMIERLS